MINYPIWPGGQSLVQALLYWLFKLEEEFLRIPIFLALIAALSCQAQQVSGPKTDLVQGSGGDLKLVVVQGEGALNNIRTRSAAPLIVEVRDASDKPVAGAEVVFQLPPAGPGGVFNGWMRNQTARSSAEGRAETNGFTPNDEPGRFNIKVTATSGAKSVSAIIAQTNTTNGSGTGSQAKSKSKMWKIVLIVGAAGLAGGIVAATRGGSSTPPTPPVPITVIAGPITIGGPR
jgi:hypothetical protein